MKLKKLLTGLFLILSASFRILAAPAQADSSSAAVTQDLSDAFLWQTVLSGKVVAEPACLRYGFCVITDAKKIDCLSWAGVKLWEKELSSPRSSSVFALADDFVLICQNNTGTVSLLNPSGLCLWETKIDFECKGALSLWDGRFLIFGSSDIVCYGINGIKKWHKKTGPQQAIINDINHLPSIDNGGYVYFNLSAYDEIKISPFGSSSYVTSDLYCPDKNYEQKKELVEKLVKENFSRERIKKAFLTPELDLVLCKEDWNIELYSPLSKDEKKKYADFYPKKTKRSYRDFFTLNSIYTIITNNDEISNQIRLKKLSDGLYGEKELLYASEALNVLQSYQNEINTNQFGTGIVISEYEANAKDFEVVIKQIPLFASTDFSKLSADYILHTNNFAVLKLILNAVSSCGYDPDLQVLGAIQSRVKNISYKNEEILCAMCDAVYEICRFMGRSAYYKKGKLILADFLSTQNTNRVKAHARKTFSKIKLLEL